MTTGSELRKHARYSLALSVRVRGQEVSTRDISATGIYFTMSPGCEPGSRVEFDLVLPSGIVADQTPRIRCLGRVVRVDRGAGERIGVAATIDSYDWVRENEP